jgi:hypothetical protein
MRKRVHPGLIGIVVEIRERGGCVASRFAAVLVTAVAVTAALGIATASDAAVICAASPLTEVDGCLSAGKTKLFINDDPDPLGAAKDKMQFLWLKGDIVPGGALGNPAIDGGTEFAVCIYDGDDGVHVLVKDLQIPASSTLWSASGDNGFSFTDKTAAFDGVLSVRVKADAVSPGKSQLKLKVRGANFDPPGPPLDLPLQYFEQSPTVILNVVNSQGACWFAEYDPIHNRKVSGKVFKALSD